MKTRKQFLLSFPSKGKSIQMLSVAVLLLMLISCSKKSFKPDETNLKSKFVKVQDVLKVVEAAVAKAMAEIPESNNGVKYTLPASADPDNLLSYLKSVEVELGNSFAYKVGTDVSFWIVKGGISRSATKATSFTYSFEPKAKAPAALSKEEKDKLEKSGKDLIDALKKVGTCLKDFDNGAYDLRAVTVQVQFEVTTSTELGAEFKIVAFGISPSAGLEWDHGNTITLNFEIPAVP